jgi:hypothetical protein
MNNNNIIQYSIGGLFAATIALLSAVKLTAAAFPIVAAIAGYVTVVALFAIASGDYRRVDRSYRA